MTASSVCCSAKGAAGTSICQCPQCYRDLTLIRIAKPNGCYSEFISAGLDPLQSAAPRKADAQFLVDV